MRTRKQIREFMNEYARHDDRVVGNIDIVIEFDNGMVTRGDKAYRDYQDAYFYGVEIIPITINVPDHSLRGFRTVREGTRFVFKVNDRDLGRAHRPRDIKLDLMDDLIGGSITGEIRTRNISKPRNHPMQRRYEYEKGIRDEILRDTIKKEKEKMNNKFNIKQVIYNETEGITTVLFQDGEVVLVKKAEGTEHNIYQAVASAVVRRVYGSNTAYKRQIGNVKVITPKPKKSPEERFETALENFVNNIMDKINNSDTEEGED